MENENLNGVRRRVRLLPAVLALFLFCTVYVSQAKAIEIYEGPRGLGFTPAEELPPSLAGKDHWLVVLMQGRFEPGDARHFENFLERRKNQNRPVGLIILDSPGGDVVEAMRIGETIRSLAISTQIGTSGMDSTKMQCSSACIIAYSGGVNRYTDWAGGEWPTVALHRPFVDPARFASLSSEEARDTYSRIERATTNFLLQMGMTHEIVERMFATRSTDAEVLTPVEMYNLRTSTPYLDELLTARCGGLSRAERLRLEEMVQPGQHYDPEDPAYIKNHNILRCKGQELYEERRRLLSKWERS